MIKTTISIAIFLIGSLAYGQSNSETFSLLAHGGLAGSQVQGDGLAGFDKLNIMFGIGVETSFKTEHAFAFEINYVQKGSKKNANPEKNDLQMYRMSLGYIQVPVYFNYRFTPKISALAGPAIGFLISSNEENLDGDIPVDPEFEPIDLSVIVGVQYWVSERFRAELRYDQSILPIRSKQSGDSPYLIGKQYNLSIGVYACYTIK